MEENQKQISFVGELLRKGTHMVSLVVPMSYHYFSLSKENILTFLVPALLLMIISDISRLRNWSIWNKVGKKYLSMMVRQHESSGDFTGATYILSAFCFTIALFSKPVAIAALAFIIVGDTLAALIGRKFGKHKFGNKSFEGSFACLVGTFIVAFLTPDLPLAVGLFGAFVATIVEALPLKIDDNLSVPLISGAVMMVTSKIFF